MLHHVFFTGEHLPCVPQCSDVLHIFLSIHGKCSSVENICRVFPMFWLVFRGSLATGVPVLVGASQAVGRRLSEGRGEVP